MNFKPQNAQLQRNNHKQPAITTKISQREKLHETNLCHVWRVKAVSFHIKLDLSMDWSIFDEQDTN